MTGQIITIDFRNDTIFAAQRDDGVFIAIKPISDSLGLKWHGQFERLNRDPILAEGIRTMRMPSIGGVQETTCLRLDLVHGWLFTIDHERVRPECRERVLAYKRECYRALFEHFHGKALKAEARNPEQPTPTEAEAAKLRMVTEARLTFGHRAAQEMWFRKGLETVPAMFEPRPQPSLFDAAEDAA